MHDGFPSDRLLVDGTIATVALQQGLVEARHGKRTWCETRSTECLVLLTKSIRIAVGWY